MRFAHLILLLCCVVPNCAADGFTFPNFKTTRGLSMVDDAGTHGKAVRLTPAKRSKSGAVWFETKQSITHGFDTTFQFQLTSQDHRHFAGADGFAFVAQNEGTKVVAGKGSAAGFNMADSPFVPRSSGIPRSLAVFFDTWRNEELDDPSGNYVAICTNSDGHWPARRLAYTRKLAVDLKDKRVHRVRILFSPPRLSVFLDDSPEPVLTAAIEMPEIAGADGKAFVGFTAATGNGFQNHDILSWSFGAAVDSSMVSSLISFMPRPCLPNRTLCTPDEPVMERRGEGQYHIVLPANLEWGAAIDNPTGKKVSISDAIGTACWDPRAGSAACAGPDGAKQGSTQHLLDPTAAAGSLIVKTSAGKTYFSVNGQAGNAFRDNEGYFEFDVRLQ